MSGFKAERFECGAGGAFECGWVGAAGGGAQRVDEVLRGAPRWFGFGVGEIVGRVVEAEAVVGVLDDERFFVACDRFFDVVLEHRVEIFAALVFRPEAAGDAKRGF